ncbi:hypothetical protein ACFQY5_00290 [Paeniroseomonas aquatica]|uniref:hypothetical protein n=1 Tax=Paeniroseomonas aquatica TaxID=373043 RepID=UPI0036128CEE
MPAVDLPESLRQAARRASSLVEFEATVTAPRFGYPSYAVYCEVNRPAAALPQIRVPTLVVMAADDPLVPIDPWRGSTGPPARRWRPWRWRVAVIAASTTGGRTSPCPSVPWRPSSRGCARAEALAVPGAWAPACVR